MWFRDSGIGFVPSGAVGARDSLLLCFSSLLQNKGQAGRKVNTGPGLMIICVIRVRIFLLLNMVCSVSVLVVPER